jgi:hypothetical protein
MNHGEGKEDQNFVITGDCAPRRENGEKESVGRSCQFIYLMSNDDYFPLSAQKLSSQ